MFVPAEESVPDRPVEAGLLGRYENLGEIARGGMGMVYRVRDCELDRELALKVMLRYHPGPEHRRRFVEEARVAGQLQHPGIPPVHEIGEMQDGGPYYTMKLIDGQTLAAMLADRPDPRHDLALRLDFRVDLPDPGFRACPRRDAPRHEARQRHGRRLRRDPGDGLGAGQGGGAAEPVG